MPETVAYEFDAPGTLWIRLKNGQRRRAEEGEIVRLLQGDSGIVLAVAMANARRRETPSPPPARRQDRAA